MTMPEVATDKTMSSHNMGQAKEVLRHKTEDIRQVAALLTQCQAQIEPQFMQVCQGLQELHSESLELKGQATQAATIMGHDAGQADSLQVVTEKTLNNIQTQQATIRDNLENVVTVGERFKELNKESKDIKNIAQRLHIIGLNVSMEASRLDDTEQQFSSLADEIKTLAGQVDKIAKDIRQDLDQTQLNQRHAQDQIAQSLASLEQLTVQARQRITDAVGNADEMMRMSSQWLEKISTQFTDISSRVTTLVFAVQFHDITRQQLEHVVEVLSEIAHVGSSTPDDHQTALSFVKLKIQHAQLEEVVQTIDKADMDIGQAYQGIGNALAQLENHADDNLQVNCQRQDPFAELVHELNQLEGIFSQADSLSGRSVNILRELSQQCEVLSGYIHNVQRISEDLDLKALNAIIMSEQLGFEGRTLEVLSQEVYGFSKEAKNIVKMITDRLATIQNQSQRFMQNGENVHDENGEARGRLEQCITQVSQGYEDYQGLSGTVAGQRNSLAAKIESTRQQLEFLIKFKKDLTSMMVTLNDIIQELSPCVDLTILENSADLEALQQRYTMQNERTIHQQITRGNTADDSSDDGVELFGNSPDDNVELFDDEPDNAQAEDDELGDNVELF